MNYVHWSRVQENENREPSYHLVNVPSPESFHTQDGSPWALLATRELLHSRGIPSYAEAITPMGRPSDNLISEFVLTPSTETVPTAIPQQHGSADGEDYRQSPREPDAGLDSLLKMQNAFNSSSQLRNTERTLSLSEMDSHLFKDQSQRPQVERGFKRMKLSTEHGKLVAWSLDPVCLLRDGTSSIHSPRTAST